MADKRTLDERGLKFKDSLRSYSKNKAVSNQIVDKSAVEEAIEEPVYDYIWENDRSILEKLDENQRAERRRYVRVPYMQKIECFSIADDVDSEPVILEKPLNFLIIDISVGGIGIVCDSELEVGKVLTFKIIFDNLEYEVSCQVIYCFESKGKFRAGLKLVKGSKEFIKHLKILVARITLQKKYNIPDNKNKPWK